MDSMPWPWAAVPVCLLATLSYDPIARRNALRALNYGPEGLGELWRQSADLGLDDVGLARVAYDLLEIARAGMRRLPCGYLPAAADGLVDGYLDRVSRSVRTRGVLSCVSR